VSPPIIILQTESILLTVLLIQFMENFILRMQLKEDYN
jgi:hypothetical protein